MKKIEQLERKDRETNNHQNNNNNNNNNNDNINNNKVHINNLNRNLKAALNKLTKQKQLFESENARLNREAHLNQIQLKQEHTIEMEQMRVNLEISESKTQATILQLDELKSSSNKLKIALNSITNQLKEFKNDNNSIPVKDQSNSYHLNNTVHLNNVHQKVDKNRQQAVKLVSHMHKVSKIIVLKEREKKGAEILVSKYRSNPQKIVMANNLLRKRQLDEVEAIEEFQDIQKQCLDIFVTIFDVDNTL